MAGDWIKIRHSLLSHPKTVRMMSALKADKFRIVGGLMSVWCLFDTHSEDGQLSGYTLETLDAMAAWDGFSAAMQAVEWLGVSDDGTLVLPRFDTHNGQSAKRRAQDSDRKREVRKVSASDADKKRTREEKRREEKKEKKNSAPTSSEVEAADDSPVVALIPLNSGEEFPITQNKTNELAELYPGVDVAQALRSMRGWVLAKPERRKTRRGVMAFITGWLDRAQNQGGGRRLHQPQAQHGGSRAAGRML